MRTLLLAAGAATLAISAPVSAAMTADATAQPEGKGNKGDKGDRGNKGKKDDRRGGDRKADKRYEKAAKAQEKRYEKAEKRVEKRIEKAEKRAEKRYEKAEKEQRKAFERRAERRDDRRYDDRDDRRYANRDSRDRYDGPRYDYDGRRSLAYRYNDTRRFDCPPGLQKKNNGCLPPGQAKKQWGRQLDAQYRDRRLDGLYSNWWSDGDDYRYRRGDDYIYRITSAGAIAGLIPLFDRPGYVYPVGSQYPEAYDFYNVPGPYRSNYGEDYRYGDGAIYRVDPTTQVIQSIAALLTGDVGLNQPLPSSYSVYNVPYDYRDQYRDTNDDWYRYSDGGIYRVDPTTRLVTALVQAII